MATVVRQKIAGTPTLPPCCPQASPRIPRSGAGCAVNRRFPARPVPSIRMRKAIPSGADLIYSGADAAAVAGRCRLEDETLKKISLQGFAAGLMLAMISGSVALAQEVTLRLHQFLPPQSTVPAQLLTPWAQKVEADSQGRIKVEIYSSMALGGQPADLYDQVREGVVDLVYTLVGYTPGRFPRVEVLELPFLLTNAEATSRAYWDLYESEMKETDYRDVHMIATWVHGPGLLHVRGKAIHRLEDMQGLKLRGPTRIITNMLGQLGATPVGMPVPAVPEALSRGVIDGAVVPWEVTTALKLAELTDSHTDFAGDHALYTAAFVLAMNKARYDSLPDDLKAVIDANSGPEVSAMFGRIQQEADAGGRNVAVERGNELITLDETETGRWKEASQPVIEQWYSEMEAKGIDGRALHEKAQELVAKYTTELSSR